MIIDVDGNEGTRERSRAIPIGVTHFIPAHGLRGGEAANPFGIIPGLPDSHGHGKRVIMTTTTSGFVWAVLMNGTKGR